ncbi:extracellular solute-binding protein [Sphaerisporangium sp. TRM90804]|uniref:extracellular solute-binding protein n=1 Tax=Sphaerisporangium sp. TRM90804 TaxID=3031113 RepID=UPI00244CF25E|nr:extracellular solute-binding protein [Sphaerisporangium sp. TRM90804]MDH2430849.1 extracellular solute-binding protein [Sphaerisporangium sp. TRM90804]
MLFGRKVLAGAIASGLVLAAAACGGGQSGQGGQGGQTGSGGGGSGAAGATFTYWTSGWQPDQIAEVDAAFAKANPGMRSKGQFIASSDQYLPKVISALRTGTHPTVLLTQNPSDLPVIAQSGKLIPLDGKLTAETGALYPGIREALFHKGRQLGMALAGVGDIVLFYNKKALADAGIERPPATWAELAADAAKLSDPAKDRYGFYVPLGEAEWITFAWSPMLHAEGGSFLNAEGTATAFNSPAGVKALTTWVDLIKNKAAPSTSYAQAGSFDGAPAFASGTVAMIVNGQWAVPTFEKAGVDFGVAPMPAGAAGTSTSIGIGVAALLKTGAESEKAGLAFLKFLSTPEQGAYLAVKSGGLPSDPAQLDQPALKEHIAGDATYPVFAEAEKTGKVRPMTPAYNAISQSLWTEINAALKGRKTPAEALAEAARAGDAALKKLG